MFSRILAPGMGDLVQRNVLFGLLRAAYPQARLTWVLGRSVARVPFQDELVRRHSLADEVMFCPDADDNDADEWARFAAALREQRFQVCVVDPASTGLGVREAAAAGIGTRIAVPGPAQYLRPAPPAAMAGRAWRAVMAYLAMVPMLWRQCRASDDELITHPMRLPDTVTGDPDVYDYAVALAAALSLPVPPQAEVVPRLPIRPEELPSWSARRPFVGVQPGGSSDWNRRWPLARYAELSARLVGEADATVLVLGSAGEDGDAATLRAEILRRHPSTEVYVSVGEPLNRIVNLIDAMDLLVCNDSGPAHLAAALSTPTVVLYGPTGDEEWARIYPAHVAVNRHRPCQLTWGEYLHSATQCATGCVRAYAGADGPYPRCLTEITVDDVWPAVLAQLAARAERDLR